ncbi:MAG: TatD family hydrolase [Dysgonamonadaceae bacterium]|nr:TatD family hydrolase [Dysgonamonadaceae bacterium]
MTRYLNIHTHQPEKAEDVFSIRNIEIPTGIPPEEWSEGGACSIGIHPRNINGKRLPEYLHFIEQHLPSACVKAIGECGLDRLCETPRELQLQTFRLQIGLSEKFRKPVIIHCVKAFDELIALHKEIQPQQSWIIHGFRGKPQQMQQLVKQGFYLSFGIHFNEETLRKMPLERLFLENDDAGISIKQVYQNALNPIACTEETLSAQIAQNMENCRLNQINS